MAKANAAGDARRSPRFCPGAGAGRGGVGQGGLRASGDSPAFPVTARPLRCRVATARPARGTAGDSFTGPPLRQSHDRDQIAHGPRRQSAGMVALLRGAQRRGAIISSPCRFRAARAARQPRPGQRSAMDLSPGRGRARRASLVAVVPDAQAWSRSCPTRKPGRCGPVRAGAGRCGPVRAAAGRCGPVRGAPRGVSSGA
jgi:hypothetical protein